MDAIGQVGQWLQTGNVVVFTGAGMSTESGIPDFRSPGGVWAQNRQIYFDEFMSSAAARYEYWRQKAIAHREFHDSQPNEGHQVLARWEQQGWIDAVITQNIDGLHQLAGNATVLELHGTARTVMCLDCQTRFDADQMVQQYLAEDAVPPCPACKHGRLKHATISFGQALDADLLHRAFALCNSARLVLALGSSLVVEPAASLPRTATQHGARLIIINRDATPLDAVADVVMRGSIGDVLTRIDASLQG